MDWVSVSARLVLAAVFAIAAAAKLLDQAGVRETLRAFRAPSGLVPATAIALPVAEALVSAALLITPTARAGGVIGAVLLSVFTAGVIAALRRGERPDCHCFGQATSTPIGRGTVVRNAALIALGVLAATAAAPDLPSWLDERDGAELAALGLGLATVALAALAISSRGAQGALELEVERLRSMTRSGLEPGTPMPDVQLTGLPGGDIRSTWDLVDGRQAVLVFLSSDCPSCEELMPSLGRWQRSLAGRLPIIAIGSGDAAEYRDLAERHGLDRVLVESEDEAMHAFDIRATPSAVAIGPGPAIEGQLAEGLYAVRSLIRRALADAPRADR
jgi:thiol-disulfide isomerase/thioredoxin